MAVPAIDVAGLAVRGRFLPLPFPTVCADAGRESRKAILSAVALSLCQLVTVPPSPSSTRESLDLSVIPGSAFSRMPSYRGLSLS